MAKEPSRTELSSSDYEDETSSYSDNQQKSLPPVAAKKDSIKNYVANLLNRHGIRTEQQPDLTETQIHIDTQDSRYADYENISAFRQYHSNAEGMARTGSQRRREFISDDDNDLRDHTSNEQSDEAGPELNLDPNPIIEERESVEQRYKQKVYLRQLQPPTPQPVEIQVQEVLIPGQTPKPPIHVRVGKREPRTPSPIVIKTAPPQPPLIDSDQPIVYNKYVPPPKQPPQQIIIHRHPDLPPKPRPIVVEQWLPYKPAPKRIIKHSLPPEALQTPPPPHNIIVSYAKPRALIEVELVRLPIVKIDPYTYQQMSAGGHQQLAQHPSFQHEQIFLSGDRLVHAPYPSDEINWRI
ncbi:unnamed protein product [Adineta steineri]|uniref:Uncharacterized protein n=1 Tax=Adineta steineri TaxID=433720 RepID=A0A819GEY8_9BILA|nr:unnamed protein product [Adineta steineri]CAF3881743.1 unnamed protein product [Adineta steineri]